MSQVIAGLTEFLFNELSQAGIDITKIQTITYNAGNKAVYVFDGKEDYVISLEILK